MRTTLLFLLCSFIVKNTFATLYTWTGAGNKQFGTAANWSPSSVPTSVDDVIFNISDSVNFLANQSVNSLKIQGTNTIVRFTCNSTVTTLALPRLITITNSGALPDAFLIDATCTLIVRTFNTSSTCYFTLDMSTLAVKGKINGTLELGGQSNSLSRVELKTASGFSGGNTIVSGTGKIICQPGAGSQSWSASGGAGTSLTFLAGAECLWNKDGGSIGSPYFSVGSWLRITGGVATGFSMPTGPYTLSRNANLEVNCPGMGSNFLAAISLRTITLDTLKITNTGLGDVRYSTGAQTGPNNADTIRGSLLILANGKLDMGASSVSTAIDKVVVLRDIISAGKIVKTGTSIDTIELASANNFQTLNSTGIFNTDQVSLKINTRDSVVLTSPFTINSNLNLKKGWIISSDINLLTIKSNAIVSNYSNISFVIGPVRNTTDNYSDFEYPVGYLITGNTGLKRSVTTTTLGVGTINAAYKVKYVRASPYGVDAQVNAPLDHVSSLEYWAYNFVGGTGIYRVKLTWYDPNSGGVTDINNLRIACRDANPGWSDYGGNIGLVQLFGPSGGSIPSSRAYDAAVDAPNPYYTLASLTADNPLPLVLLQFDGQMQNNNALLHWRFAQMVDGLRMHLQESEDGLHFKTNTIVTGNSLQNAYHYATPVFAAKKYYRLMWRNANNDEVFSQVILLSKKANEQFAVVFPNPVLQIANLQINATKSSSEVISIFDASGKLILTMPIQLQKGINNKQIDCSQFAAGMCTVSISNGLTLKMQK
jgi:Secretion system C-terminal sorting domain